MKHTNNTLRSILIAIAAGGALLGATSALAQYAPGRGSPDYSQAHSIPVGINVSTGWHGDRYWDGHRYWEHDEWMHRHPHARDPHRYHDEDRRPPQEDHRY